MHISAQKADHPSFSLTRYKTQQNVTRTQQIDRKQTVPDADLALAEGTSLTVGHWDYRFTLGAPSVL